MTRPAIPVKVQVSVAIRQGLIACPLCRWRLYEHERRVLEHMVPRAWSKDDSLDNLRWVHESCAKTKTFGTKATSASGDLHKIAKATRLAVARLAKSEVEKKLTKTRWRLKKKMDGTVVKVRTR